MTAENDIEIAKYLAENGVPIFLAPRAKEYPAGGHGGTGFEFPVGWQTTKADPAVLDDWKPGMAVGAVMGHVVDGVDKDPRSGGELPDELMPTSYGQQNTPSGGTHDLVAPLGIRSKNGALPGVDVKAGKDGDGHGFLFIAPTRKLNHSGVEAGYSWAEEPDLDYLTLIGRDDSGKALAEKITADRKSGYTGETEYDGPAFEDLSEGKKFQAAGIQAGKLELWQRNLEDAAGQPEGWRDLKSRGWEELTRDFAWALASIAMCPWMPMKPEDAEGEYSRLLPDEIANDPKCRGKWSSSLLDKAAKAPVDQPPWADFEAFEDVTADSEQVVPESFDESSVAEWAMNVGLRKTWCWVPGFGWMRWTGKVWEEAPEEYVREAVRKLLQVMKYRVAESGADKATLKTIEGYQSFRKSQALTSFMRGMIEEKAEHFDDKPYLLNVGNGVVDLKTGQLHPHGMQYRLTKKTDVNYVPGATHPDWEKTLQAVDPEVADWLQVRFGQAATGLMTADDVVIIGQGSGSNGKTTLITAIRNALGDHVVTVPERVLNARPGDHPAELMVLKGARIGFIDETPEASQLNTGRLKTLTGSTEITARGMRKDPVKWTPTHSMMVMTNHVPTVTQNDHGTWRRLALVKFEKTFPSDEGFRRRVMEGTPGLYEAVLAWIVEGARRWATGEQLSFPEKVREATDNWRMDSDKLSDFVSQNCVLDTGSSILATDFLEQLNDWLREQSQHPWGDQLVAERMQNLDAVRKQQVLKRRVLRDRAEGAKIDLYVPSTPVPTRPTVWDGLRWRRPEDDQDALAAEFVSEKGELL